MGYMTTVTFLNDAYSVLKKHPEQVTENILQAMDGNRGFPASMEMGVGNHVNCMKASMTHHADDHRLYVVGENMQTELGVTADFVESQIKYGVKSEQKVLLELESRKRMLNVAKRILEEEEKALEELEKNLKRRE